MFMLCFFTAPCIGLVLFLPRCMEKVKFLYIGSRPSSCVLLFGFSYVHGPSWRLAVFKCILLPLNCPPHL